MRLIPTAKEVTGIIVEGWDDDPYNRDEHYLCLIVNEY